MQPSRTCVLNRRRFLKTMGAGLSLMPLAGSCAASRSKSLNVLFIAVDDLNDWVGCLAGHPQTRTPNLDRLAARGVLFTNAYCAAPACNPSRAALMTGIRPASSGVYHNSQPWRSSPVLKNAVTLPQHFRNHGYQTMGSGKIYHDAFPDPVSWDYFWPALDRQKPADPLPPNQPINGLPNPGHFDWGPLASGKQEMGDWQVSDWVIAELKKSHDKPFFLACGFFRPHLPWYVPQEYFDRFPLQDVLLPETKSDDLDDIPEAGRKIAHAEGDHARVIRYDQWRQAVRGYLASINFMDECLGRVLNALDHSAYCDNTAIVLWSDHGWHLGEKLHWRKFALWEEATHNVLLFSIPGLTKADGRCSTPVSLLDIYPTLLNVCGLTARPELHGQSLVPLLQDPNTTREQPALTTHGRNNHSLRSSRWRYIRYKDGSEELYDHDRDDLEWCNLAMDPQYADVKKDLARLLPGENVEDIPAVR